MNGAEKADDHLVLVTGATGTQGGAVARHLLSRGFRVRALTRDPEQDTARTLAEEGAEIVRGDLEDGDSLARALEGAWGAFGVQTFQEHGLEAEVEQGLRLIDAARDAGVEHFVQASVAGADEDTGIPHFETKTRVEAALRDSGLRHTILRPVFFMENWLGWDDWREGGITLPMSSETTLQQIAATDIGAFAAMAFHDPEAWAGRAVELAGDERSMEEIAEALGRGAGRPVSYTQIPWDAFEEAMGEEMTVMFRWFEETGYSVDIEARRREHPALLDFDGWVGENVRG